MTYKEIAAMIAGIGLPYAYDHFDARETPGHPPFICFTYPTSDNFGADNRVYKKLRTLNLELYTDAKDHTLEARVEQALDDAGLYYESSETYIESEKMYMVTWESPIMITEEV